ncbi:hypothetical protein P8C59_001569 [Phyllachora maydis]|uniref:Uncharacterized protein n=1 Tax=Phyllachora maydis TaxID=1825666 RepID=A0AAD9HYF3_9PEZI|nr:hypothetical protein P8C59_001569 [Phyllachora maydis]
MYMPAVARDRDEHKVVYFISKTKSWHWDDGKVDEGNRSRSLEFSASMVARWWEVRRTLGEVDGSRFLGPYVFFPQRPRGAKHNHAY